MTPDHTPPDRTEVALSGETIEQLTSGIRAEVKGAIADSLTDENAERFMSKCLEVLQRQATEKTGEFVLGGLSLLAKRLAFVVLVLVVFYWFGGWPALKAGWAIVSKG